MWKSFRSLYLAVEHDMATSLLKETSNYACETWGRFGVLLLRCPISIYFHTFPNTSRTKVSIFTHHWAKWYCLYSCYNNSLSHFILWVLKGVKENQRQNFNLDRDTSKDSKRSSTQFKCTYTCEHRETHTTQLSNTQGQKSGELFSFWSNTRLWLENLPVSNQYLCLLSTIF